MTLLVELIHGWNIVLQQKLLRRRRRWHMHIMFDWSLWRSTANDRDDGVWDLFCRIITFGRLLIVIEPRNVAQGKRYGCSQYTTWQLNNHWMDCIFLKVCFRMVTIMWKKFARVINNCNTEFVVLVICLMEVIFGIPKLKFRRVIVFMIWWTNPCLV